MWWHVGTMGFSYANWLGVFYPAGSRSGLYLPHYASVFGSVELDTTFHATPAAERVGKWAAGVPAGFIFCVKTPRHITHDAAVAAGVPAMRYFLRALRAMEHAKKLGPILLQFPPGFSATEFANLRTFLSELPTSHRYAVEFRHPSWMTQETFDLLQRHRVAWVTGDYGCDPFPIHATTDFLYLRFIGIHKQFAMHDREQIDMTDRLAWWHERILAAAKVSPPTDVFTFFSNDYAGHAPATAARFAQLAGLAARAGAASGPQKSRS